MDRSMLLTVVLAVLSMTTRVSGALVYAVDVNSQFTLYDTTQQKTHPLYNVNVPTTWASYSSSLDPTVDGIGAMYSVLGSTTQNKANCVYKFPIKSGAQQQEQCLGGEDSNAVLVGVAVDAGVDARSETHDVWVVGGLNGNLTVWKLSWNDTTPFTMIGSFVDFPFESDLPANTVFFDPVHRTLWATLAPASPGLVGFEVDTAVNVGPSTGGGIPDTRGLAYSSAGMASFQWPGTLSNVTIQYTGGEIFIWATFVSDQGSCEGPECGIYTMSADPVGGELVAMYVPDTGCSMIVTVPSDHSTGNIWDMGCNGPNQLVSFSLWPTGVPPPNHQ